MSELPVIHQEDPLDEGIPELAELCRIHDIGLELIECSSDLDDLLRRVLEEYERRLAEMRPDTLGGEPANRVEAQRLRALIMFATQAAALKQRAVAAEELKRRAAELERLNDRLNEMLDREERMRSQLDGILGVVDTGIVVLDGDGRVEHANAAAIKLTGESLTPGARAPEWIAVIDFGEPTEIRHAVDGSERHWLVSRQRLEDGSGLEVVAFNDVTERDRQAAARHRIERLGCVLKTIGGLCHNINNPLTTLLGRAQMLQMRKGSDPYVDNAAAVIEESSLRIAVYVRELAEAAGEGREEELEKMFDTERPEA